MRKLVEKRGMILRVLLVAIGLTLPAALVTVGMTSEDSEVSAAEALFTERAAAHGLLREGEIEAGAVALLESLRGLPDDAGLLEAAHGSLQLLAFTMVGLMPDDLLDRFRAYLDPVAHPVDELVLAYYVRETEQYAAWRGLEPFDPKKVWARIDALQASPSALARAGGSLMAASPYLWTRIGVDEVGRMIEATNALAAIFPDSRLTTEVVREHVRACLGPNFHPLPDIQALFGALSGDASAPSSADEARMTDLAEAAPAVDGLEAVEALSTLLPWNRQVQTVLANDAVAGLARTAAAVAASRGAGVDDAALRQDCIGMVQDAAANTEDASVRDWCLRSMVLVDGLVGPNSTEAEAAEIRAASGLTVTDRAAVEKIPLDEARAALNQLIVARQYADATISPPVLEEVLMLPREAEPVDINLFEQAPRRLAHYGYALVRRGEIDAAAAVFEQLAGIYPGSVLCDKWQKDATHLRQVAGL